jgi:hypothetical protein
LYDIARDVGEIEDLSGKRPDVVRDLAAWFDRWLEGVGQDPTRGTARR